jgi:hypothetical protein
MILKPLLLDESLLGPLLLPVLSQLGTIAVAIQILGPRCR